ncbi:MAG: hypothetical protein ABIY58_02810, partial [Acidimicrobiales bacterium]
MVTGAPGSFTDAAGAMLAGFGIDMHSPAGAGIVELQRRMARDLTGSDQSLLFGRHLPLPVPQTTLAPFAADAAALLAGAPTGRPWGWADPSTALLLDWWDEQLVDPLYLLLYGPPWDVGAVADT